MGDFSPENEEWFKWVIKMAGEHKDKYGSWSFDIETAWDTQEEEPEEHFDNHEDFEI